MKIPRETEDPPEAAWVYHADGPTLHREIMCRVADTRLTFVDRIVKIDGRPSRYDLPEFRSNSEHWNAPPNKRLQPSTAGAIVSRCG